jgi:hypothetical protein
LEEEAAKHDQIVEILLSLQVDHYDVLAFVELQQPNLFKELHPVVNFHATIEHPPTNTAYFRNITYITQEQSLYSTCYIADRRWSLKHWFLKRI